MFNFRFLAGHEARWSAGSRISVSAYVAVVALIGGGQFPLWAGSNYEPIDKAQAQVLMAEAKQLELENQIRDAYYKYKRVESTYEVNDAMRSSAWDNAQRLRLLLETRRKDVESELARYRQEHGKYPESLADIKDALPEETRVMLDQFDYRRESDTKMSLHDGVNR